MSSLPNSFGPLEAEFHTDGKKLIVGKIIIVAFCGAVAILFLGLAIFGPQRQIDMGNPEGATILRLFGFGFVLGAIGLAAVLLYKLSRNGNSVVGLYPGGLRLVARGGEQWIPWTHIKQLTLVNNAGMYIAGGLMGFLLMQAIQGGQQKNWVIELTDGKKVPLPGFLERGDDLT